MEAVLTSETSDDNHFTRQYIPEDNSEHKKSELNSNNVVCSMNLKNEIISVHLGIWDIMLQPSIGTSQPV
jgi:hypothetical protein